MSDPLRLAEITEIISSKQGIVSIQVRDGLVYKLGLLGRVFRPWDTSANAKTFYGLSAIATQRLAEISSETPVEYREEVLDFARAVTRYQVSSADLEKTMARVERAVVAIDGYFYGTAIDTVKYRQRLNAKSLQKWMAYGFPSEIFHLCPCFTAMLKRTHQDSVIAKLGDTLLWRDGDGQVQVEGRFISARDFIERFELSYSQDFRENFIVEKGSGQVWSYHAGGQGFIPYHPYQFDDIRPLMQLSEEEYAAVHARGLEFVRPASANKVGDEACPFVMQVVSSYVEAESDSFGVSEGLTEVFRRSKHPWLRLVRPSGEVYSVGYNWGTPIRLCVAQNEHGRLRSPDRWEFMPCDERLTTNIAITEGEAAEFFSLLSDYQRAIQNQDKASPTFNLMRQNCTVFVKAMLQQVVGIEVDTEATLIETLQAMRPVFRKKLKLDDGDEGLSEGFHWPTPLSYTPIPLIAEGGISALCTGVWACRGMRNLGINALFLPVCGGFRGPSGARFAPEDDDGEILHPPAWTIPGWFYQDTSSVNLPAKVQMWQRIQGDATVVIARPQKVHVAPISKRESLE